MCSGKSTVGRELAHTLGWEFVDVDEEIQRQENNTVAGIFQEKGEAYFRNLELQVLTQLSQRNRLVISTGGGLGANPVAMELMKNKGLVVWLDIPFQEFLERCKGDENRPLLKKSLEEIQLIYQKRKEVYREAHLHLDATKDVPSIVKEIVGFLNR